MCKQELWSLLQFVDERRFGTLEEFEETYEGIESRQEVIEQLHADLKPFFLRRIKKHVEKSLPQKTERILRVQMTPLQEQYYKWILEGNVKQLMKGAKGSKGSLMNVLMQVRARRCRLVLVAV